MNLMRVALVNDVTMVLEVLRRVVVSIPGVEVAWMARTATAVEAVDKCRVTARPDPDGHDHAGHGRGRGDAPDHAAVALPDPGGDGDRRRERVACLRGTRPRALDAVNTPVMGTEGN